VLAYEELKQEEKTLLAIIKEQEEILATSQGKKKTATIQSVLYPFKYF
jgi:hypothetical protein